MKKGRNFNKHILLKRCGSTTRVFLFALFIFFPALSFLSMQAGSQPPKTFIVKVNEPKGDIQPTMWGIFFEDINLGADGGIYAELVKNRSFEFVKPLMGWTVQRKKFVEGNVLVINRKEAVLNLNLVVAAQIRGVTPIFTSRIIYMF